MRRTLQACALALIGATAGEARAGRIGVVALAPAEPPMAPAEIAAALARAIERRGDVGIADALAAARARRAGAPATADRLAELARARALLDEGWRSYLAVRTDVAAARLGEARAVALAVVDLPGGVRLLAEIALRQGAVALALGDGAEASRQLGLAARLAPDRAVDDAEFKPAVVAAYQAARAGGGERRAIGLRSMPAQAALEVDGRAIGASPQRPALEAGQHLIVARRPGHRPRAAMIEVASASAPDELALELAIDPTDLEALLDGGGLAPGAGPRQAGQALEALLRAAELDAAWLVAPVWRRGTPAILAQACGGAPVACDPVVELRVPRAADLPAAVAHLAARAGGPRSLAVTLPTDPRMTEDGALPPTTSEADRSAWRSPWLWAGVSAVAVAATAGLLFLADGEAGPPRVVGDGADWRPITAP